MVLILYSNKEVEYQATSCIRSLEGKITDDVKIVYYTIGFKSDFSFKNLIKIEIPYLDYPTFHYYKAELSLRTIKIFPEEQYFAFTDTDVLFSRRFDFEKLKHDLVYPKASYGPHEYPFIYEYIGGKKVIYDESALMMYFNVPRRSCRYVWTCFYSFNRNCIDFLEEWVSILNNKYLMKDRKLYHPMHDEQAFNICLWKRNATDMLGYVFLNTHNIGIIKTTESKDDIKDTYGNNLDAMGSNWEYIHDSSNIILYHGAKEPNDVGLILDYLLSLR